MPRPGSSPTRQAGREASSPSPRSLAPDNTDPNRRAPEDDTYEMLPLVENDAHGNSLPSPSPPVIENGSETAHDVERGSRNSLEKTDDATATFRTREHFAIATVLTDFIAFLVPLALLVFVVVVGTLDGKEVEKTSLEGWQNAVAVLSTLFPISFALVVGRFVAELARWKLESGTSIGLLEQLIGSRTVGSTVQTIWQLRAVNVLGAGLLIIWTFSPLGAQAILRMLRPDLTVQSEAAMVTHFDIQGPSQFAELDTTSPSGLATAGEFIGYLSTLYTTIVSTPGSFKSDTMDLWGNVKIPFLEDENHKDWVNVSSETEHKQWSSLAGIPLRHDLIGNKTFSIESGYIRLRCSEFASCHGTSCMTTMTSDYLSTTTSSRINLLEHPNGTWHGYDNKDSRSNATSDASAAWGFALNRFVDPLWFNASVTELRNQFDIGAEDDVQRYLNSPIVFKNEQGVEAGPTNLLLKMSFSSNRYILPDFPQTVCNVTQEYVESRISCLRPVTQSSQHSCRVAAQRPSRERHAPEQISHLSFPGTFNYFSQEMPLATMREKNGRADLSMQYLVDPTFKQMSEGGSILFIPPVSLGDIDQSQLGLRFSQLLNTYLLLSQVGRQISSSSAGREADREAAFERNVTVAADATALVEVYRVPKVWMSLGILSCVVMLVAGALGVVLVHVTQSPEILGYVSTIVRNSKLVEVPPNTGWLDGPELTRMIKDKRVRYGVTSQIANGEELGVSEEECAVVSREEGPVVGIGYEEKTERIKSVMVRTRA
ncbi:hypothetical protein CLIM01_03116 [Colletotrichum limetticola]|uniref:Uncharacterized protein n=1 Tax=Colletotrichum limetticola TaxID=1209924 RepID=A0ABQ9Q733_9PEZI|nr:hypothetical protein CLIM01_03116 [Colletotrichum limetticola]